MDAIRIPAGSYWLGDPCYTIYFEDSQAWLDAGLEMNGDVLRAATPSGHTVLAFATAHGDGVYLDRAGRTYPVDSGRIGLVPAGYRPRTPSPLCVAGRAGCGCMAHLVTFETEVECSIRKEGSRHTLVFGDIEIETGEGE